MTTATERIPILVTKADKAKFVRKAKSFGLSISEFARTAMDNFDPTDDDEIEVLNGMIVQIRRGTAEAEKSLDEALAFCAESDARLRVLDAWLHEQGYVL